MGLVKNNVLNPTSSRKFSADPVIHKQILKKKKVTCCYLFKGASEFCQCLV